MVSAKMKSKTESIIINKEEHAKISAYALLQIQSRIVSIPNLSQDILQATSDATLRDITNICILKMREFCTFLIEENVIKENDLEYLLRKYIPYQISLANMTTNEITKILMAAKKDQDKLGGSEEDKKFDKLLNALKTDGPIH